MANKRSFDNIIDDIINKDFFWDCENLLFSSSFSDSSTSLERFPEYYLNFQLNMASPDVTLLNEVEHEPKVVQKLPDEQSLSEGQSLSTQTQKDWESSGLQADNVVNDEFDVDLNTRGSEDLLSPSSPASYNEDNKDSEIKKIVNLVQILKRTDDQCSHEIEPTKRQRGRKKSTKMKRSLARADRFQHGNNTDANTDEETPKHTAKDDTKKLFVNRARKRAELCGLQVLLFICIHVRKFMENPEWMNVKSSFLTRVVGTKRHSAKNYKDFFRSVVDKHKELHVLRFFFDLDKREQEAKLDEAFLSAQSKFARLSN